jgi:hypothetical protein
MRRTNVLRQFEVVMVLLVVASTAVAASASTVTVTGRVFTHNCCGDDTWSESKQGGGNITFAIQSSHVTKYAFAGGGATQAGAWFVRSDAIATASPVYRGAYAESGVDVDVRDQVTPMVPPYIAGGRVQFTQHLFVKGRTTAIGTSPGRGEASAYYQVLINGSLVTLGSETLWSDTGYLSTMPRGDVSFTIEVETDVPYDLRMIFSAYAAAYGIEEFGGGDAKSDFGSTFVWGGVTDVVHVPTGQPIPVEDFHLYGEDGFDWAQPPAIVPEPAAMGLFGFVAACLTLGRGLRFALKAQ